MLPSVMRKGQWGYYTDVETGILLLTHRYFDPATGRFLTRDPAGCEASVNLYAYVGNDPVNEDDPLGYQRQRKPKPPKQGDSSKYQHCISEGVQEHCKGVGVSDDTLYAWIWCIIYAESNWDPGAKSSKGATGCMQIMPVNDKTCKQAGYPNWQTDPCQNIKCGVMLLCNCLRQHKGNLRACDWLYASITDPRNPKFADCMKQKFPKVPW